MVERRCNVYSLLKTQGPIMVTRYDFPLSEVAIATSDSVLKYSTLAVNALTGDVEMPPRLVFGLEAVWQRLVARLHMFKGEWFLDTRQGLPYFQAIFVKNPNINLVASLFRRVILDTPGVLEVRSLVPVFDPKSRAFTLSSLEVVLSGGVIFRPQPGTFIVTLPKVD